MSEATHNKQHPKPHPEHFKIALIAIFLSISLFFLAFISEKEAIVGFASGIDPYNTANQPVLREFNDINSLGSLAKGAYYIDDEGIVYWADDESKPAIAYVNIIDESQKNRHVYIDNYGNVGYVIS